MADISSYPRKLPKLGDLILFSETYDANAADPAVGNPTKSATVQEIIDLVPSTGGGGGSITSVAATGFDGISVIGSPITSSGTLFLSLTDGGIPTAKLASNIITINGTSVSLGGSIDLAQGSVTSVGLSTDVAAFQVTNSPVTSTGTLGLNLLGGSVGQFLKQDGTWATLPEGLVIGTTSTTAKAGDTVTITTDQAAAIVDNTNNIVINATSISTETSNRIIADGILQDNINSEATTRASDDITLQSNINTETSDRIASDSLLQSNINAETSERIAEDSNLQSQITATDSGLSTEIADRIAADNTLQSNIDTETASRISADNTLTTNLSNEVTNRTNADTALQSNITAEASTRAADDITLQDNIDTETASRISADSFLQQNIDNEATARTNADNTLQSNIDAEAATRLANDNTLQANITTEQTARINADIALQGNLDTETASRISGDSTLQTNIDNEASTRSSADSVLTSNLSTETTNRTNADTALQSQITSNDTDITNLQTAKQNLSEKDQANGYAPLDSGAKIPLANLPDSILGQLEYKGTWNANTDTPTLPSASTVKGNYYVTSVAGVYLTVDYAIGDWVVSNGTIWEKVDNSDAVTTVFGRLGNVVANVSDYSGFYPLISDLNTEISNRTSADTTLQNNINSEASTRATNDTTLQTNITAEASTRASADTTLQSNINTEASTRASADAALQTEIDNIVEANDATITIASGAYLTGGAAFTLNQAANETITLNVTATDLSTASTIAARDASGDLQARLFRSEYDTTNATVGLIMTQVDTVSNNYIRPTTPAQFRTAVTDGYYAPATGGSYLPLAGGTLTGALSGTSGSFSGDVAVKGTYLNIWGGNAQSAGSIQAYSANGGLYLEAYGTNQNIGLIPTGTGTVNLTGDLYITKAVTPLIQLTDTTNSKTLLLGVDDANAFIRTGAGENFYLQVNGGSNAITILNNGNVGIGTTSPVSTQHLYKDAGAANDATRTTAVDVLTIQAHHGTSPYTGFGSNINFKSERYSYAVETMGTIQVVMATDYDNESTMSFFTRKGNVLDKRLNIVGGNVGIGTTSPLSKVEIDGGLNNSTPEHLITLARPQTVGSYYAHSAALALSSNASDLARLDFLLSNNGASITAPTVNVMTMLANGYVGIGTPNPLVPLQVTGNIRATGTTGQVDVDPLYGAFRFYDGTTFIGGLGTGSWASVGNNADIVQYLNNVNYYISNDTTSLVKVEAGGNVGIGTTSPLNKLDVSGGVGDGANYDSIISLSRTSSTSNVEVAKIVLDDFDTNHANLVFRVKTTASSAESPGYYTDALTIKGTNGNVGIGTTSPGYELDVTGTIRATGDVIAYSDARVKDNVVTIDNALEKVTKLRGVSYTRNDVEDKTIKIGVIAQEVLEVLPEVVQQDEEGRYSVAYGNMVGLLIEAMKELKAEVDELKSRL